MERVNIMANCLTELIFQQALEGFTGVNDIGVNLSECGVRAGVLLVVPMMPLSKAALRGGFFFEPVVITPRPRLLPSLPRPWPLAVSTRPRPPTRSILHVWLPLSGPSVLAMSAGRRARPDVTAAALRSAQIAAVAQW